MSISPWLVGATDPVWQMTIADSTGSAVNLTGVSAAAITLSFRDTQTGETLTGTGTFALVNALGGVISYTLALADVATSGTYDLTVTIPMPDGRNLKRRYSGWVLQA